MKNMGVLDVRTGVGVPADYLPNRISFLLNLQGPSEPVSTACSSSLVALHRAAESIRRGDCEQAIVGGVNLMLTPNGFIYFSKAGILSQDGHCRTFDHRANGYVRGSAGGAARGLCSARARARSSSSPSATRWPRGTTSTA